MKPEEFVRKLKVKDIIVEVGMDDYGQCYFFEYTDKKGELKVVCCGSYNPDYKDEIAGYFGVDISEVEDIYSSMSEEDYISMRQKTDELRKQKEQLDEEITNLEMDLAVENMLRNEEFVGRCFKNGDKYYKVVSSFGCSKYNVWCLCLDFSKNICECYRTAQLIIGISRYSTVNSNNLINVEQIAIGNLKEEIKEEGFFEEKFQELMSKILEDTDILNKDLHNLYAKDILCIGKTDLEERRKIRRTYPEDILC